MGQFSALFVKNWILYKRGWVGSFFEIIVPIVFMVFVVIVRRLAVSTDYVETQFVGNNLTFVVPNNLTMYPQALKNCNTNKVNGNLARNGIVALAPIGSPLVTRINQRLTALNYTTQLFASDGDIDALARHPLYGIDPNYPRICFGLSVESESPNYVYKLKYNISESPSTIVPKSTLDAAFYTSTLTTPFASGMLTVNNLLQNEIFRTETNDNTSSILETIAPMTQQAYHSDPIYTYLGNSMDMLCLLPLLIVYLRQTSSMLSEKEKKIRETMKIMGMTSFNYYVTWFIRYFAVYVVIHIICSAILVKNFSHISFGVVLITFLLFDLLLIVQSCFIQVFFTRAKMGMVIALLFFVLQYIVNFIIRNSDNPTYQQNLYGSISPHSAFALAMQELVYAQSVAINLNFGQLTTVINYYSISTAWLSFVIHIVFWLLLTMYLEQVFPNEWGAKKHPLFCFNWMWRNKEHQSMKITEQPTEMQLENVEDVEERFKEMEKGKEVIKIINLNKEFDNGRKAVRDLNLTIYNDQIFVLLGHNGAGKTTTISMLTGLLEPTSGEIQAIGYNLKTDMDQVRKKMGVCPQHDTLYQDLTVEEHLFLFGTFKGLAPEVLQQQVTKLIRDVNLQEKTHYLSKDLSGGQKRRLSVAMAFAGDSKLIFLDQPTSGMDTSARRYIWQMMKNYKNDRIIILTTHFMDQADFLGDRICIMNDGRLVCSGSTIFLKNKFGVGYNITIVKKDPKVNSQPIIDLITKHVPNCKVTTDVSAEVAIQLPMEEVDKFPMLFDELDAKKKELNFQSYGVSITTLEQVFLKVAEIRKDSEENESDMQEEKVEMQPLRKQTPRDGVPEKVAIEIDEGEIKFFRHTKAILIKRIRITYRDLKTVAFEFIFPVVIILLAMFLLRISFIKDSPAQTINFDIFKNQGLPLTIPVGGTDANISQLITELNAGYSGKVNFVQDTTSTNVQSFDSDTVYPIKQGGKLKAGVYLSSSPAPLTYSYYALINTRSVVTPLLIPTMVNQALINTIISNPITITVIDSPLPRTYQSLQVNNSISGFLGAFVFSMALAFKFASIISFIVKEREDRCKHQQIVSGMSIYAYWFGNFIFDLFLYLIVAFFAAGMCMAFGISSLTDGDALTGTWVLFVLYGLANIPFSYLASFLFTDYGSSQAAFYFFNFLAGGLISVVILVLRNIGDTAGVVARALAWVFRLIPAFSFGEGLTNQGSLTLLSFSENNGKQLQVFDYQITLSQIIYLSIETVVFFALLFLIQHLINSEKFMRYFTKESGVAYLQDSSTDEDVQAEATKAQMADPKDYTIITKDLRKVYMLGGDKHKIAVDRVSFTVQKGEVFGLLGVNGAGKTTTFKMLSGEVTSTSGDAYFNGMKISENLGQVRKSLGYCPQFDALLQNLTVREQLELYYDMKGLPMNIREKLINDKIEELNLKKYEKILSGTLSGGNKRKLSVACAMIGDPSILFLDQPSTGMDPQARRFMWRIISSVATEKKQSTIILTTHSMEEAEALSTRLGIMVQGNFHCMGTPQHIKSKFGQGYELEVKIDLPSRQSIMDKIKKINRTQNDSITNENLGSVLKTLCSQESIIKQISEKGTGCYLLTKMKQHGYISIVSLVEFIMLEQKGRIVENFIMTHLGDTEVIEHFQAFFRFRLKAKTPIGRIFKQFQENKVRLGIQQYSIKQATVQQIFNRLAGRYQDSDEA